MISAVRLLDCTFDAVTRDEVRAWSRRQLASVRPAIITTVNVSILMMMRKDRELQTLIQSSKLTVADGLPIVWLSRHLGTPLPERVTGVDLCDDLAELAADTGSRLYLLGGTDTVIDKVRRTLLDRHPDLVISGTRNGYFSDDEAADVARQIRNCRTDILLVGMGVPRQELFLRTYLEATGAKIALPVGGSFDVISGLKKRAPKSVQKVGLEWLFRLVQEPRRLFWRYATTNTEFLARASALMFRIRIMNGRDTP